MVERITTRTPSSARYGHEFRYHLAAGYAQPRSVVLDAACGSGYGARILAARGSVSVIGVDRDLTDLEPDADSHGFFLEADLQTWEPDFAFDAFVGFETIEHLVLYGHYLAVAKQARRHVLLSVPVIPTVHTNQYHRHDFEPGELREQFEDDDWECVQTVSQPSEKAEIYVFARR